MLQSKFNFFLLGISILCLAEQANAETSPEELSSCPIKGSDIVEDHNCMCTKDMRKAGGNLFGSGPYLWYSNVCAAAKHAGVTGDSGGPIRVEIRPSQSKYVGTLANGSFSSDYGSSEQP
ncbi:LCCL domain-containing protein, partial [Sedimentitalea sp.]|uniref:LCCL domain-containing protein n=1 Tax=Sedimentitalea sp. TaxID=2048915 RepID=UPI0032967F25